MGREEVNFTVFWNGARHKPQFSKLSEARSMALKLSNRDDFKGEAVYIFNIDQGHTEEIYMNGKKIVR